jgi:hypothetical protein
MSKGRCLKADSYAGYSIEHDFMPVPVDTCKVGVNKNSLYDHQVYGKMFPPSLKHEDLYNPMMIFDLVGQSNGSNQARDTPSYGNRCVNINMDLKEVSM